jgi:hypothetical protein
MSTGAQQLVERGRAVGRIQGQAEMLLVLLHHRFVEVPPR